MKNAAGLNPSQIITVARGKKKKSCQARLRSLSVSFIYFLTSVLLLEGQKSFFTSAFLSGSPFLSPWV